MDKHVDVVNPNLQSCRMAAFHPIKTNTELAHCAKITFTGCVDNTLPDGHGLLNEGNTKYWFGSVNEPAHQWTQIVTSGSANPVAIGQGHFAIGKEIFKIGQAELVCTAEEAVVSGSQGNRITRMLPSGDVLVIVCKDLGKISQSIESYVIHCQTFGVISGMLTLKTEAFTRLEDMNAPINMFYFKGHVVVECDMYVYKLIDYTTGAVVDTVFGPNFKQTRFIDGGSKLGVFTYSVLVNECDLDDLPKVYHILYGTIDDVADGRFVFTRRDKAKFTLEKIVLDAYGLPQGTPIGWSNCKYATDTILTVNFRLACCISAPANFATPAGHEDCILHTTPHRDTYGLIYLPTKTVIRVRDHPVFGNMVSNTPEVISTTYSQDRRYLAVVVKSKEATAIPTFNFHVVVIDTTNGKYDTVFSVKFGDAKNQDALPCILAVNSEPSPAAIYQVYGSTLYQPIFKSRTDAIACKLHELVRGIIPMEVMLHVADYMV